jgi:signal transduction histidine kinase
MSSTTEYASPDRSSLTEISNGFDLLSEERYLLDVLGAVSGITAILDGNRQIIYANKDFLELTGLDSLETVLGKRPGEAVSCIHSADGPSGCGTSGACSVCGAVNAILESQRMGIKSVKETRITSVINNAQVNWDLRVTSSPVNIREKTFYVFTVQDISNEKRRQSLERTFFHDILNSAGNLNGLLTILKEGTNPEESRQLINLSEEVSRELIEEIVLQRQIRSAENGDLVVKPELLSSAEILKSAVSRISRNEAARSKRIIIVDHSSGAEILTDKMLLHRVLMNLLINAAEATDVDGTILAEVENDGDIIRYRVRNEMVIPQQVRMQIFQRSFSTKGKGRGIGTYSIKLLTEMYLNGKTGFTSNESDGTVFFIELPKNGIKT